MTIQVLKLVFVCLFFFFYNVFKEYTLITQLYINNQAINILI